MRIIIWSISFIICFIVNEISTGKDLTNIETLALICFIMAIDRWYGRS